MIVMPANSTGWFMHSLARETGRLGHLFSPGAQRGPWPWFPYALDNGAYSCWDRHTNVFDFSKWKTVEQAWQRLIFWAQCAKWQPMWAIVPDVPGNAAETFERWEKFAPQAACFPLALAVQNGMTVESVLALKLRPAVIAVGGTDEWKKETVSMWCRAFPRVHLLRCNSPTWLYELEAMGVESCDGTGWARGNYAQTSGLEIWARSKAQPRVDPMAGFVCKGKRKGQQYEQESLV